MPAPSRVTSLCIPDEDVEQALEEVNTCAKAVFTIISDKQLGHRAQYVIELEEIRSRYKPRVMIAVLGATGAGKSSLLNAILGDDIVPTSGMAACTSVVTEISYNPEKQYEAHIQFISRADWKSELTFLLADLRDAESEKLGAYARNDPAAVAWAKIHAVYPELQQEVLHGMDADAILNQSVNNIAQLLGSTVSITASTSAEVSRRLSENLDFLADREDGRSEHWPLIRQIKLKCPAAALATGAILVDLPGVADTNAARAKIAVNDRTAKELLGHAFKRQMQLDGVLNSEALTFVATKCDDISCREVVRDLRLEHCPKYQQLQDELAQYKSEISRWDGFAKSASDPSGVFQDIKRPPKEDPKAHVYGVQSSRVSVQSPTTETKIDGQFSFSESVKRKVDEANSEDNLSKRLRLLEDSSIPFQYKDSDMILQAATATEEEAFAKLRYKRHECIDARNVAKQQLQCTQRRLNAYCAARRSEFSTQRIKKDFRSGLQELDHDHVQDIPVFTVSARDYMRLTEQTLDDGEAACFTTVEETGIPALQEWCHKTTLPARKVAIHSLLMHLQAFVQSVRVYVAGIPAILAADREAIRKAWRSPEIDYDHDLLYDEDYIVDEAVWQYNLRTTRFRTYRDMNNNGLTWRLILEFRKVVKSCICDLQDSVADQLADKCNEAGEIAAESAVEISDEFARSKHWQTWRAILRRGGSELNTQLAAPFSDHIATSWCNLFETEFFGSLEEDALQALNAILDEIVESMPEYLKHHAKMQGDACVAQSRAALGNIVAELEDALQQYRKKVSRDLVPRVEQELVEGYDTALYESGRGSVQRQKDIVHDHIDEHKIEAFEGAAMVLKTCLAEATESIGNMLDGTLVEVAIKVEKNISAIWEAPVHKEETIAARGDAIRQLDKVLKDLDVWIKPGGRQPDIDQPKAAASASAR